VEAVAAGGEAWRATIAAAIPSIEAAAVPSKPAVIPAKAGLSTAELVIHVDLVPFVEKRKWIPAFAGMTTGSGVAVRGNDECLRARA
jgi:hypothetical protein